MEKRTLYSFSRILLASGVCFLWTVNGVAQVNRANLNGTVTDTSGSSVPKAKVELIEVDTGFTRQAGTGNSGVYSFVDLPIGTYDLTSRN